jgi:hypothetical protein
VGFLIAFVIFFNGLRVVRSISPAGLAGTKWFTGHFLQVCSVFLELIHCSVRPLFYAIFPGF